MHRAGATQADHAFLFGNLAYTAGMADESEGHDWLGSLESVLSIGFYHGNQSVCLNSITETTVLTSVMSFYGKHLL